MVLSHKPHVKLARKLGLEVVLTEHKAGRRDGLVGVRLSGVLGVRMRVSCSVGENVGL
jgi:hypothetical protein